MPVPDSSCGSEYSSRRTAEPCLLICYLFISFPFVFCSLYFHAQSGEEVMETPAVYSIDDGNDALLPLTTIFTPPPFCRTHWTYEASYYNSVTGGVLIQNALPSPFDTPCFPSGFSNDGRGSQSQIYSPGHCPAGYATPAQFTNDATTTYICCQS